MEIENDLMRYSNPKVHAEILKLNIEQKIRIKNFIQEIIEKTERDFIISELKILNDRLEIAVNYKLTMF